jgi:60 kDa SS-A/Ro ribonucleoprotein
MVDSLKGVSTRKPALKATPQTQKAAKGQKKNAAGGFTFKVSDMDRAKRFLILGSESNFYTPGAKLSEQNAKTIIGLASDARSSRELVDAIVEISTQGRAPRVNPALFALAIAASHGDQESKAYALSKLNDVARTGTHIFLFAGYVEQFRGWGRALKRAIANWYTSKSVDQVAYQAVKYQNREGYTHRDLFRLSHPETADAALQGLGEWVLRGDSSKAPAIVEGFVKAHAASAEEIPALVREYRLSWEMVPTQALNDPKVWEALLDGNVPLGALLRQLPRLTRIGLLAPLGSQAAAVVARLTDKAEIERARIHPIAILTAMKVYAEGKSDKGSSTWTPNPKIVDALDKAFYLAFKNVEPAGKRTLIGLDVSGSMDGGYFGYGQPGPSSVLTPREATAAVALVTVATEPSTHVIGFTANSRYGGYYGSRRETPLQAGTGEYSKGVSNLDTVVSASRRLDDVIGDLQRLPMGATDCALPMLYALEQGLEVDTFVIMTDNETFAGDIHPHQALRMYRDQTGIDAKLVVFSTEASRNTIADPEDAGQLDIAGFDSAAPSLLADFSRGF